VQAERARHLEAHRQLHTAECARDASVISSPWWTNDVADDHVRVTSRQEEPGQPSSSCDRLAALPG